MRVAEAPGFVSNRRHEDLRDISIPVEELLSNYT
jgi:hypothetical protein